MEYYTSLMAPGVPQGTAVALGYFDGLHIGHRAVIAAAVDWAARNGASPALFTFRLPEGHPLKGGRIISPEDKHALAQALGVRHYVSPAFADIRDLSPTEFVRQLVEGLHARALFCGENFTFGARAAGNVTLLQQLCDPLGVHVEVVPLAEYAGAPVSSTRIRSALAEGDIPAANAMLGQPYGVGFAVQSGQGLGRKLGTPTVNQAYPAGYQLPRQGVYITRALVAGNWYPAATGLGSRPTVNEDAAAITCETFIPNCTQPIPRDALRLEFYRWLAPPQRFSSLEELRRCIQDTARQAEAFFAAGGAV